MFFKNKIKFPGVGGMEDEVSYMGGTRLELFFLVYHILVLVKSYFITILSFIPLKSKRSQLSHVTY